MIYLGMIIAISLESKRAIALVQSCVFLALILLTASTPLTIFLRGNSSNSITAVTLDTELIIIFKNNSESLLIQESVVPALSFFFMSMKSQICRVYWKRRCWSVMAIFKEVQCGSRDYTDIWQCASCLVCFQVKRAVFIIIVTEMHQHISADRLIAHHRARQDYTESPVNALQFAYSDQRYIKMTYELLRESDILKQKILHQIIQDFSLCENINLALLSSDLLSVVLEHFKNKHDTIRLLSARVFKKLCASPMGRKTVILKNCIEDFHQLTHDPLAPIKAEAYDGLIHFAEYTEGITCILSKDKILVQLVDKLIQEKIPEILLKAIILLKVLMQGEEGTPKALNTEIISRLMHLISHKSPAIQYNLCMTLANISFNEVGKAAIVAKGHIKEITQYVNHHDKLVREAVSLLLCSLAQINQGKIEILAYCPFPEIVKLLDDESPTVLNAVQLIANLAENPRGRALATEIQKKLEAINSIERKYIDQTLEVIRWRP